MAEVLQKSEATNLIGAVNEEADVTSDVLGQLLEEDLGFLLRQRTHTELKGERSQVSEDAPEGEVGAISAV